MAKKSTDKILIFGGIALLLVWMMSRSTTTGATLAPGVGGPAGSAGGNIIAGITGLLKGFTSGSTASAATAAKAATAAGLAGQTSGTGTIPTDAPDLASATNVYDDQGNLISSSSSLVYGPPLPGITSTNDLTSAPAVTSGGGGGGLNDTGTVSSSAFTLF